MQSYKHKKRFFGTLCVVVSAALIVHLIWRIDMKRATVILNQASYGWLVAALLVTCCNPLFTVWRWMGVLRAQKGIQLGFSTALRANLMANVLNSLLPSKAGDAAKAIYLRKHGGLVRGMGTVILERSVDFMVLGILGITGYLTSGVTYGLITGLVLLGGISCIFLTVFLVPLHRLPLPAGILEKVETIPQVYKSWIKSPGAILQTVLASLCCWSMGGLIVCCLVSALNTGVTWGYVYGIFPTAILAGLVPLTVGGVGTRDSAFVFFLVGRMPLEEATLVGLGYTLFAYWLLSLISLPAVFWELVSYFRRNDG
ncbi:lysylphosphatidylglycerol synthase transmembrane domain-containing protein [Desulforhabdus amnigena]|uniref:Lysylphosphatidylglycerol synthase n=1 Tax=Desulforhabdus amnigena TaxID=40218 RepID=A0A9W6FVX2_9BACT|nr:lysylphosphatidylglycerol synthase transmembrane domain-containing protein [Desulforhabdus amnigena]GLI35899.1 hypothetical protein DAMNIGENAA_33320 [Desulforhabdus amnigena]